jgi:hypothetical protein
MMPVQAMSQPVAADSGKTDTNIVPFPRAGEPCKGLRELRTERGWSLMGVAKAMTACATDQERKGLPDLDVLKRNWARWEAGTVIPDGNRADPFYRPIIARMFGTKPENIWPQLSPGPDRFSTGNFRDAAESRRSYLVQVIGTMQAELSYLDAVLSIPAPATAW